MVDTRLMRSFVVVAEELHFGRAAARLHISQPPLSKQIQQLEQAMGVSLLRRSQRSVELTDAGRVFLDEARAALKQTGRAVELARRAERGESGHLSVGFIDAAIYSLVPEVVRRFTDRYPGVELTLTEMRIPEQLLALAERRLHVGLVHPPIGTAGLASETVLVEPLVVALPQGHRLADIGAIELDWLAREPLVQFPRAINPSLYDEIVALCHTAGFSPRIIREASPKQTIVGLVSAGLGVSLLPACLQNLRRAGVIYRPLAGPNLDIDTSLVWRSDDRSPTVAAFIETVRDAVRTEPAAGSDRERALSTR